MARRDWDRLQEAISVYGAGARARLETFWIGASILGRFCSADPQLCDAVRALLVRR